MTTVFSFLRDRNFTQMRRRTARGRPCCRRRRCLATVGLTVAIAWSVFLLYRLGFIDRAIAWSKGGDDGGGPCERWTRHDRAAARGGLDAVGPIDAVFLWVNASEPGYAASRARHERERDRGNVSNIDQQPVKQTTNDVS